MREDFRNTYLKEETLDFLDTIDKDTNDILCSFLTIIDDDQIMYTEIYLRKDYSDFDLYRFLEDIDVFYYNGYGYWYVRGIIWFKDGTYAKRVNTDGNEWWYYEAGEDYNLYMEGIDKSYKCLHKSVKGSEYYE